MADNMSIDTKPSNPPHHRGESEESAGSTPEREQILSTAAGSGSTINMSHDGQQPKRKGGRKPLCIDMANC
ncbi:hypothetical protein Trco_005976 [Trichoderma cornu-damae]|uniref:Uncharacterized protein n=1 Tax=Trichoderma cornu-damae TaxID=654480 RepID=A0A9P8QQD4_9HYPO|nr:hypothetical protein Trco_005976 [Trichoderma cornu-damae]